MGVSQEWFESIPDPSWLLLAFAVGVLVGYWAAILAHRLPIMMDRAYLLEEADETRALELPRYDLFFPDSACLHCGAGIPLRYRIPLVSYLLLCGQCHACGERIAPRYLLLEVLGGLMGLSAMLHFGPTVAWGWVMVLGFYLLVLTFIDLDHQLLPDSLTLPLLWLGLLLSVFNVFVDSRQSILGAALAYGCFWLLHALFLKMTGKDGLGRGDFKLIAALGAWLGFQSLPFIILIASVLGSCVGVALLLMGRHGRQDPIPFGPFLAFAGWATLLAGDRIIAAYWAFYAP